MLIKFNAPLLQPVDAAASHAVRVGRGVYDVQAAPGSADPMAFVTAMGWGEAAPADAEVVDTVTLYFDPHAVRSNATRVLPQE
jgi:hypothetical protein